MEWIDGEKGPWKGEVGIEMVSLGLKCSVDQLLSTGMCSIPKWNKSHLQ